MDGIINVDKPRGLTSAKTLYKIRSITKVRKSGHAGTLDPGATGVLIICQGKATKLVERLMDQPKVYRATARLDLTSESYDVDNPTTDVTVEQPPTIDAVRETLSTFEGSIMQVPPRFSAIKLRGMPAYKRAARGETFEIEPRPAMVYWMHLHEYSWPELDFEMCCGRGTYVRSVIRDLGIGLKTGGCLTSLVRTQVGPFKLSAAWTIDKMQDADAGAYLIDREEAIAMLSDGSAAVPDRPTLSPPCADQPR